MITWAAFLADEVAERLVRARSAAAVLSGLLHGIVILAAFIELPWTSPAARVLGIDITVEFVPLVDEVSLGPFDMQMVTPEPMPDSALLLGEPVPGDPPPRESREAMPAPQMPVVEAQPPWQEAVVALALPEPSLEEMLPPVEALPSVDARDFARERPEPQRAQAAAVQPPSVKRPVQDVKPAAAVGSIDRSSAAPFRSDQEQRRSEEDYFWQLVRRISQYRFYARSHENVARGLVVTRMTIARDGRLLDLVLVKSSGFPALDSAIVETIRGASPFAPLPPEMARDQQTFVIPVNYTREH